MTIPKTSCVTTTSFVNYTLVYVFLSSSYHTMSSTIWQKFSKFGKTLGKTISLRTLKKTLSQRTPKRTVSLWTLKRTLGRTLSPRTLKRTMLLRPLNRSAAFFVMLYEIGDGDKCSLKFFHIKLPFSHQLILWKSIFRTTTSLIPYLVFQL